MRDKIGNALIRLGRRVRRTKYHPGGIVISCTPTPVDMESFRRAMRRAKDGVA